MVKHAVLLEFGFVHDQGNNEGNAKEERHHDVHIWSEIWILGPGKPHAEEHKTSSEEEVSNPVQLLELFKLSKPKLGWKRWWVVEDQAKKAGNGVDSGTEIPVISESLRMTITSHCTSNEQANQASQGHGNIVSGLSKWSVLAWKNFGRDCVEERLDTIRETGNTLSCNCHVHGRCPCNNDGANYTAKREDDEEPSAAPVIGSLGDWRRKNYREDGNG